MSLLSEHIKKTIKEPNFKKSYNFGPLKFKCQQKSNVSSMTQHVKTKVVNAFFCKL